MTLVFPSIKNPNIRYVMGKDIWSDYWNSRHVALHPSLSKYDTMGDGDTAHTPNVPVLMEDLEDFSASFVEHVETRPLPAGMGERDFIDFLRRYFTPPFVTDSQLRFFARLRPSKDGWKKRYFNADLLKTSTSPQKKHDRRWEVVPDWADGSTEAVMQLALSAQEVGVWGRLCVIHEVDEWSRHQGTGLRLADRVKLEEIIREDRPISYTAYSTFANMVVWARAKIEAYYARRRVVEQYRNRLSEEGR